MLRIVLLVFALVTPALASDIAPIPDPIWQNMQGKSYNTKLKDCAQRDDLRLVTVPYWNFKGEDKTGQLIVNARAAKTVAQIFTSLHASKAYAFERIDLVDAYGGDDHASMMANNTSAYNCRLVAGSTRLSAHAKGLAIDINPLINPYVWKGGTSPKEGEPWDTTDERKAARNKPGMILPDSAITKAFKKAGWGWGGDWKGTKDYQHFSATGK
jgi:hypothetical protein